LDRLVARDIDKPTCHPVQRRLPDDVRNILAIFLDLVADGCDREAMTETDVVRRKDARLAEARSVCRKPILDGRGGGLR
jgi:hypothetical protein